MCRYLKLLLTPSTANKHKGIFCFCHYGCFEVLIKPKTETGIKENERKNQCCRAGAGVAEII